MTQIIEQGHVIRGWLGISMRDITPDLAETGGLEYASGVLITGLFEASPAAHAGLRQGDILVRINQQPILDARHMLDLVAGQPPGSTIMLEGMRNGRPFSVETIVAQRPRVSEAR
jgi:S1-C subfamily serine protease